MIEPTTSSPTKLKNASADLLPLKVIRTETVLSRLPIHNLSKRGEVNIHITKYNERGELELDWDVSHSKKYGDARQLAFQLDTLIIGRRIDELGRPLPKVIRLESLRQICEELGLRSKSGDNTKALKRALHQNAGAYITAKLRYKATDGTERVLEAGFTRYSVVFTGERLPDGSKADGVYLILNEPFWEVLNNAPTRPLDYDYLKQLAPTAQRFYQIISYKIFAALKFKLPRAKQLYSEYCAYSAQQRYFDYEHVKKQMYKVHRSHLASGYIQKVSFDAATDSDGKPDWMMSYIPGPKAQTEFRTFNGKHAKHADVLDAESVLPLEPAEPSAPDSARDLVAYFHRRFDHDETAAPTAKELEFAASLIAQYGKEKARFVVEYSQEAAAATKYSPDMLIGIRKYVDAAIKKFDAREKHRQEKRQEAREKDLKNQYDRYCDQEIDRIKSTMPPDELAEMESVIREDFKARGIKTLIFDAEIRIKRDAQLAARAGVLPYEEWRKQEASSAEP